MGKGNVIALVVTALIRHVKLAALVGIQCHLKI